MWQNMAWLLLLLLLLLYYILYYCPFLPGAIIYKSILFSFLDRFSDFFGRHLPATLLFHFFPSPFSFIRLFLTNEPINDWKNTHKHTYNISTERPTISKWLSHESQCQLQKKKLFFQIFFLQILDKTKYRLKNEGIEWTLNNNSTSPKFGWVITTSLMTKINIDYILIDCFNHNNNNDNNDDNYLSEEPLKHYYYQINIDWSLK